MPQYRSRDRKILRSDNKYIKYDIIYYNIICHLDQNNLEFRLQYNFLFYVLRVL